MPLVLRKTIKRLVSGEDPWPFYLWGASGTGKTCSMLLLVDFAGGFYYTAEGLVEDAILAAKGQLRYPDSDRPIHPRAFWKELAESKLVVIDELGSRSQVSDYHYETIKRLLDEREGMPLAAASNHDLDRIAQLYDDRVASRLSAGTELELKGEDQRLLRR